MPDALLVLVVLLVGVPLYAWCAGLRRNAKGYIPRRRRNTRP